MLRERYIVLMARLNVLRIFYVSLLEILSDRVGARIHLYG